MRRYWLMRYNVTFKVRWFIIHQIIMYYTTLHYLLQQRFQRESKIHILWLECQLQKDFLRNVTCQDEQLHVNDNSYDAIDNPTTTMYTIVIEEITYPNNNKSEGASAPHITVLEVGILLQSSDRWLITMYVKLRGDVPLSSLSLRRALGMISLFFVRSSCISYYTYASFKISLHSP